MTRKCDHCHRDAVFRVAIVAFHGEGLEELWYCTERFQERVAEEPERVAGVVNLEVPTGLPWYGARGET